MTRVFLRDRNWSETSPNVGCTSGHQPISVSSVSGISSSCHSARAEWLTDWLTAEAVHVCPVTQCVCKWAVSAVGPQQRSELLQKVGHEAAGRANLVAVQAPLAADSDLLERVLQLRSLHRLPRTHHPGPEVPDPVHPAADHLGLLLSAVLPVGGQQHGRTLQEDVSIVRPLVCWRIRDSFKLTSHCFIYLHLKEVHCR